MTAAVADALARKQAAKLGIDLRDPADAVRVSITTRSMLAECGRVIHAGTSTLALYDDEIAHLERLVERVSPADEAAISALMASESCTREAAYHKLFFASRGPLGPVVSIRRLDEPAPTQTKGKG